MVNKDCRVYINFLEANQFKVHPEEQTIEAHGRLAAHLYVIGANIDGSDMKIVTFNADHAYANFSVLYNFTDIFGPGTQTQLVYLEAKDLYTGPLTVSD